MTPAPASTSDSLPDRAVASAFGLSFAAMPQFVVGKIPSKFGIGAIADGAGLVLLLLAAGALLFRPADLFPSLSGAPIYQFLVAACLVASLPRMLEQLSGRSLRANAIMALGLLMAPAVVLSHLAHGDTYDARIGGEEMAKASVLLLLVVGLVSSTRRLKATLVSVVVSVLAVTILAILQYHDAIFLPALQSVEQLTLDPNDPALLVRLCGVGVFNDPNDFSMVLVVAGAVCVYGLGEQRLGRWRWWLLVPIAIFAYAEILTQSRGGFLAALGAVLIFLPARFGWRNALPLAFIMVPVLLALAWGRQTSVNLDDPDDTFQTRLELWDHALDAFRSAPILGIGQGKLVDEYGQVAHNSFLHAFAELGLFGGTAFIGAFYLVLRGLWRAAPASPELARMRPYVLALTVGYVAGMISLSRCYTVPTQLVLAVGTTFLVMASRDGVAAIPEFDLACLRRVTVVGLLFLAAVHVFVRVMLRHG